MFIIHHKTKYVEGENPCVLYGYGGFNISMEPSFIGLKSVLISNINAVYAIANLRGGGEYGDDWHK